MNREYYLAHKDELLEQRRQHRLENIEHYRQKDRQNYAKHPEKKRTLARARYWKRRDEIRALRKQKYWEDVGETRSEARKRMKEYRKSPGHKAALKKYRRTENGKRQQRRCWLRRKYGITLEDYERMYQSQKGLCAICHSPNIKSQEKYLHVDHCHSSKRVRGLLCYRCNVALGLFQNDPDRLLRAASYLKA